MKKEKQTNKVGPDILAHILVMSVTNSNIDARTFPENNNNKVIAPQILNYHVIVNFLLNSVAGQLYWRRQLSRSAEGVSN